jgi:hypothetical protein
MGSIQRRDSCSLFHSQGHIGQNNAGHEGKTWISADVQTPCKMNESIAVANLLCSENQYTRKFEAWGLKKNANKDIWKYADQKTRKRKQEEGKDTEFEIHGRKRSKAEINEKIARNVMHTERLQMVEDIPTPDGIQAFTPVAEASIVTLREVYIHNLPCFRLQRDIQALMCKGC